MSIKNLKLVRFPTNESQRNNTAATSTLTWHFATSSPWHFGRSSTLKFWYDPLGYISIGHAKDSESQAELCSYISNLTKCSAATQTSTRFHLTPVECYSRTFSFMSPVECKCNSRTSKIQCPLLNATHVHSEESVVPILMLGHCSHASRSTAFDVLQIRAIDPNNT